MKAFDPAARRSRRPRRILPFLPLLALLAPAAAEARTVGVSNLDGTSSNVLSGAPSLFCANAFTTGGVATDRYRLTRVILDVDSGGDALTVSIWAYDGERALGDLLGTLTRSSSQPTSGLVEYTANTTITLHGVTSYFVRVQTSSSTQGLEAETDNAEHSFDGWSIADNAISKLASDPSWTTISGGYSLRFQVVARVVERAPTAVTSYAPTIGDGSISLTWDQYAGTPQHALHPLPA